MLSCWNEMVTKRPTFNNLHMSFDRMLAAESNNTYIDFVINPENLCYQVVDEVASPTSNGFLRTVSRSGSKITSRPVSDASSRRSPSPPAKEVPASYSGRPRRFARTPSPTMEKFNLDGGREDSRRPRSMMLLQRKEAADDDDRYFISEVKMTTVNSKINTICPSTNSYVFFHPEISNQHTFICPVFTV